LIKKISKITNPDKKLTSTVLNRNTKTKIASSGPIKRNGKNSKHVSNLDASIAIRLVIWPPDFVSSSNVLSFKIFL
jgi:hypothetical protein